MKPSKVIKTVKRTIKAAPTTVKTKAKVPAAPVKAKVKPTKTAEAKTKKLRKPEVAAPTKKSIPAKVGVKSVKAAKAVKSVKSVKTVKPTKAPVKKQAARMTKTEMLNKVAEVADLPLRDVRETLNAFQEVMSEAVSTKGPGEFMLPGFFKITATHVPAKKARKGINPFTKEETVFKAKPASIKLKIRPLTNLRKAAM